MSVEFRIVGIRERREKYILSMLETLKMPESIVSYDDEFSRKNSSALRGARKALTIPTDKTHICIMEDDLELCDNFVEIVNLSAKHFPNAVFSFYQSRLTENDRCKDTPYLKIIGSGMYGQCIMIPTALVPLIFYWGDKVYGADFRYDDTVIGFFCNVNNIDVMATNPCIVQHLGASDSSLGFNNKNKISRVYQKDVAAEIFDTNKYVRSKYIPNTPIKPEGGYLCGSLLKLSEML